MNDRYLNSCVLFEALVDYGMAMRPERISKRGCAEYLTSYFAGAADQNKTADFLNRAFGGFCPIEKNAAFAGCAAAAILPEQAADCLSYAVLTGFAAYCSTTGIQPESYSEMYAFADKLRGKDPAGKIQERIGSRTPNSVMFAASLDSCSEEPKVRKLKKQLGKAFPELNFDAKKFKRAMRMAVMECGGDVEGFIQRSSQHYENLSDRTLGDAEQGFKSVARHLESMFSHGDASLTERLLRGLSECPYIATSASAEEMPELYSELMNIKKRERPITPEEMFDWEAEMDSITINVDEEIQTR